MCCSVHGGLNTEPRSKLRLEGDALLCFAFLEFIARRAVQPSVELLKATFPKPFGKVLPA